jgi:cytoskeletal protein CcmA (bactofilin family)
MFNRKPEEPITDGAALKKEPRPSTVPALPANQPSSALQRSGGRQTRCVIDASLVITGNLQSERDIQLDGELNGDIHCSQLIISRDATLNGNIVAEQVVVRGRVKGVIRAGQVMLQDTARVDSEIFHKSLIVEEGACFDGESHRTDEPARAGTNLDPQIADLQAMAADMRSTEKGNGESEAAAA